MIKKSLILCVFLFLATGVVRGNLFKKIGKGFKTVGSGLKDAGSTVGSGLKTAGNGIVDGGNAVGSGVVDLGNSVVDLLKKTQLADEGNWKAFGESVNTSIDVLGGSIIGGVTVFDKIVSIPEVLRGINTNLMASESYKIVDAITKKNMHDELDTKIKSNTTMLKTAKDSLRLVQSDLNIFNSFEGQRLETQRLTKLRAITAELVAKGKEYIRLRDAKDPKQFEIDSAIKKLEEEKKTLDTNQKKKLNDRVFSLNQQIDRYTKELVNLNAKLTALGDKAFIVTNDMKKKYATSKSDLVAKYAQLRQVIERSHDLIDKTLLVHQDSSEQARINVSRQKLNDEVVKAVEAAQNAVGITDSVMKIMTPIKK